MKAKIFSVLFLIVLLLASFACSFPLDLGLGSAPSLTPASVHPNQPDEDEEKPAESLPQTRTATEESTATATLSPTADLPVFISPQIFSIHMFSPDRGWAVAEDSNRLLVTKDGGETWLDVTPPDLLPLPTGVTSLWLQPFFLDGNTAWFTPSTAAGTLFQTEDAGQTWLTAALPFERPRFFFLDLTTGFVLEDLGAGAGSHYVALHRTLDGGETWTEVFSHEPGEIKSLPGSGTKNGVTFINLDRGFIGGSIPMEDHFHFYVTNDGGATWSQETDISLPGTFSGSFLDAWQPIFIDETQGVLPVRAVGSGNGSPLLIYRSEDAGETWAFQGSVPDGQDVDFISGMEGWIAGDAGLFKTVDEGLTWEAVVTAGIPAGEDFLKVDFVDGDHGWLLTYLENGAETSRKLSQTDDGGESWILLQP